MHPDGIPSDLVARLDAAGWRPVGLAGVGARGPAWVAVRAEDDAVRAVVSELRWPPDQERAAAERLAALRLVRTEHVAAILDIVADRPGGCLLLVAEVSGPTLAAVLAARGMLGPGEVVTVVVPLARALAELHAAGLVHGDVSPANVVIDPAGRPVLVDLGGAVARDGDLGTPGFASASALGGAPITAADDVYALGRVAHLALGSEGGAARTEVAEAVATAHDPDASRRPTAAGLARRCFRVCAAEPLRIPDRAELARAELSGSAPTVRASGRRRARRPADPRRAPAPATTGHTTGADEVARHRAGTRSAQGRPPEGPSLQRHPARGRSSQRTGRRWLVVVAAAALVTGVTGAGLAATHKVAAAGRSDGSTEAVTTAAGTTTAGPTTAVTTTALTTAPSPSGDPATSGSPSSGPSTAARSAVADPVVAAALLTSLRAEILTGGDPNRLGEIELPDSPAQQVDRATMAQLAAAKIVVEGLACDVESVTPVGEVSGGVAAVTVTSRLSAHVRRGSDGSGAVQVPAGDLRTVQLGLRWTRDGWRVETVA